MQWCQAEHLLALVELEAVVAQRLAPVCCGFLVEPALRQQQPPRLDLLILRQLRHHLQVPEPHVPQDLQPTLAAPELAHPRVMWQQVGAEALRVRQLAQPINVVVQALPGALIVVEDVDLSAAHLRHPDRRAVRHPQVPCRDRRAAGRVVRHPGHLLRVQVLQEDPPGRRRMHIILKLDPVRLFGHAGLQIVQLMLRQDA